MTAYEYFLINKDIYMIIEYLDGIELNKLV